MAGRLEYRGIWYNANMKKKQRRAVHRPLSINVEDVNDLPEVRELPQDTQITINIKTNRKMALKLIETVQRQLDKPGELDFVAFTITGTS